MPQVCASGMPAGINLDCLHYPSPIDNVIVTDNDVSFTEAEIKILANWKTEIQENLTMWVPSMVESYENTTDSLALNTTGTGRKVAGRKPVPSGMFNLRSNVCDFNEVLRSFNGGTYRLIFIHADNSITAYKDRNGSAIKGFQCEITAVTKGFVPQDVQDAHYPLYVNFMNYLEFESQWTSKMNWTVQHELPNAMPESYAMTFVSKDTGTKKVVVNVFEACGNAVAGVAIADIEVIESTLTDDTVASVTDNGGGSFDVVFTDVSAGEYVKFRVKEVTGSVVNQISNDIYVEFE